MDDDGTLRARICRPREARIVHARVDSVISYIKYSSSSSDNQNASMSEGKQREYYHTSIYSPSRKVDLGPDLQPGGSKPGNDVDVQCMRARPLAPGGGRKDIVALHRRCTHAGSTHEHGDNGKQCVCGAVICITVLHIYTPLEMSN